jgi:glucose/arabinose dehydrogenase
MNAEYGPSPELVAPAKSIVPTVRVAPAKGWNENAKPQSAAGTTVTAYARKLEHPRWLYVLPNGDVLVAESDAPAKPEDGNGAHPGANRITLLRESGPGSIEKHVFLQGLNSPIGMALVGSTFYVADSDAVLRFPYHSGDTEIKAAPTELTALPAGTINHHWTKSLLASPDGLHLYVGVGSNSNAGENGLDVERERAAVWEIETNTGKHRIYASGLRNPVGLTWEPQSDALWVAVNERDELGDRVPPDYMTAVRDGGFYGWPFSYHGRHLDDRVKSQNPALVATALAPDYALGAHTASLGLAWSAGVNLPSRFQQGMFVGQHGSWNRKELSGYKVIFVPFVNGRPAGPPIDVLTGFLDSDNQAQGRPVGVAIDKRGALLVADDVGNTVWRVSPAGDDRQYAAH